jgi:hypothetical protein
LADGTTLAGLEFDQLGLKASVSEITKLWCKITDLERARADNQVFFNGFSKVIKCVCEWMFPH